MRTPIASSLAALSLGLTPLAGHAHGGAAHAHLADGGVLWLTVPVLVIAVAAVAAGVLLHRRGAGPRRDASRAMDGRRRPRR